MAFTPWQIGRIRSRLITYYFHKKYNVTVRSERRAKIQSKLGEPKADERIDIRGYNEDVVDHRDSFSWTDIAYDIIASDHTDLSFPEYPENDDGIELSEVDDDWPINNLQLQRFYYGLNKNATRDSRGHRFRALQIPPDSNLKAIYQFLKKEVHYLVDDDLVEPNNWPAPDENIMFEIGADHEELRKTQLPLLISRDYFSLVTNYDELQHSLLSIDTKYTYKPARIRYITRENFYILTNQHQSKDQTPHWTWYWGWMIFRTAEYSVIKLMRDRDFNSMSFAFIAFDFADDGEHISPFSLSRYMRVQSNDLDKNIFENLSKQHSMGIKAHRIFKRHTQINLTNLVRNYRFDIVNERRPAVLGYKDTPEGGEDETEIDKKSRSLVEELFSKIRKILPIGVRGKDMIKGTIPVEGKYYSNGLILWEGHVMTLPLNEVVEKGLLGNRLVETMDIGYPWHVAELIELGADPNYVTPDDNACPLHFIASNSSNGHLEEFTKAAFDNDIKLTFNVKTRTGQLPSDVAVNHCVDPDITEYLFKMEALEREGKETKPYVIPEIYRGPILEDLIP